MLEPNSRAEASEHNYAGLVKSIITIIIFKYLKNNTVTTQQSVNATSYYNSNYKTRADHVMSLFHVMFAQWHVAGQGLSNSRPQG